MSYLPSVIALGTIALIAAAMSYRRYLPEEISASRRTTCIALAIATAFQALHFVEEWLTGFAASFPGLFGLEPVPGALFVIFNMTWILIWIAAVAGLREGHRWALFAAFFLALAGILNGVAHPLLTLMSGQYFPGLYTSSLVFLACVYLLHRLLRSTRPV